jgi:hypothetical protein
MGARKDWKRSKMKENIENLADLVKLFSINFRPYQH